MNQPTPRSIRARVSAEEWELRVHLAACHRLVARYGMTDLIYNHITARVPGLEHHILINAYGMLYEEVTASAGSGYGLLEWPALLRALDRQDASYRH